jgi:1-deoxy-D-xylulose-5-phosphate reductoisomerase
MVAFADGAVMAQLGTPDMRVPIQYALTFPDRRPIAEVPDFAAIAQLTFETPYPKRYPCLALAYEVGRKGGTLPAVFNAANEVAVAAFLAGRIGFNDIARLLDAACGAYTVKPLQTLTDVDDAELWAREFINTQLER